jgi:hypothetical protein
LNDPATDALVDFLPLALCGEFVEDANAAPMVAVAPKPAPVKKVTIKPATLSKSGKRYNFVHEVPSSSNPKKKYAVKVTDDGKLTCNCMSWINNTRGNRTCKHTDVIEAAGFTTTRPEGKFLLAVDGWNNKLLTYCKNSPDGCPECEYKFKCYTEETAEFASKDLHKKGIV